MKKFQKVRLIKKEINNPETNFKNGYWTEGLLVNNISISEPIIMLRNKRADYDDYTKSVEIEGIFSSSIVKQIDGNLITTQNSVWEVI